MTPIELPHNSDIDLKRFRFWGEEMEALGRRLDSARASLAATKDGSWASNYWRSVIGQLLLQWQRIPQLHDGQAAVTDLPRWTIKYDFVERDHSPAGYGFGDRLYDHFFNQPDLDASWERAREERYLKAVRGIQA